MTVLQFGKYRGWDIRDVADAYLLYLVGSAEKTLEECRQELDRRSVAAEANMSWLERIVEAGYRELAKKHHPDANGSDRDMAEVNAAVERLRKMVHEEKGRV